MLVARNIAKFWLQAKYESKLFKNILLFFFFPTNLLEPWIEIWWFFLNFGLIMAIQNL